MPVMAVYNQNPHEQTGDYRFRPRWSAGRVLGLRSGPRVLATVHPSLILRAPTKEARALGL
jgi:uracil-DNA glycosylase